MSGQSICTNQGGGMVLMQGCHSIPSTSRGAKLGRVRFQHVVGQPRTPQPEDPEFGVQAPASRFRTPDVDLHLLAPILTAQLDPSDARKRTHLLKARAEAQTRPQLTFHLPAPIAPHIGARAQPWTAFCACLPRRLGWSGLACSSWCSPWVTHPSVNTTTPPSPHFGPLGRTWTGSQATSKLTWNTNAAPYSPPFYRTKTPRLVPIREDIPHMVCRDKWCQDRRPPLLVR